MKPLAVITIVRNEKFFLPRWLDYYGKIPDVSIHVLDHDSDDGSTELRYSEFDFDLSVEHVDCPETDNASWMLRTIQEYMQGLFNVGFRRVIYAEVDEFLIPDPNRWSSLAQFLDSNGSDLIASQGWNVVAQGYNNPLPETGSLLAGRLWRRAPIYDMSLVAAFVPKWKIGRHGLEDRANGDDVGLRMIHMHYGDQALGWKRLQDRFRNKKPANDGMGFQNKFQSSHEFDCHWGDQCSGGEPIPEEWWVI